MEESSIIVRGAQLKSGPVDEQLSLAAQPHAVKDQALQESVSLPRLPDRALEVCSKET